VRRAVARPLRDSLCRSFHKQRCAAGWLTGLGSKTSVLFAQACTRNGAAEVALEAFTQATKLGLQHRNAAHRSILAALSQQGAEATLKAYRMLRETGRLRQHSEIARQVLRGLQAGGPGSSPSRALAAALAFAAEGIQPGRRAWNSLLCCAATAGDVATVRKAVDAMAAEDAAGVGQPQEAPAAPEADGGEGDKGGEGGDGATKGEKVQLISSISHLCLAEAALLSGDPVPLAAAEIGQALRLAPEFMSPKQRALSPQDGGDFARSVLKDVFTSWLQRMPASVATPGGAAGLRGRCEAAFAAAEGSEALGIDLEKLFEGRVLADSDAAA
jgi:hypothetical protein